MNSPSPNVSDPTQVPAEPPHAPATYPACCAFHSGPYGFWYHPCGPDPERRPPQRYPGTWNRNPLDPDNFEDCPFCRGRVRRDPKTSPEATNFRDYHLEEDCPRRPYAARKVTNPVFPEVTVREDEKFWIRDPETGRHVKTPAREVIQMVGTYINNDIGNNIQDNPKLRLFFLRLARDLGEVADLHLRPEQCSGATIGNLKHFRRRAHGDNEGW